jgi:methionyl-tRNA formyltransferase
MRIHVCCTDSAHPVLAPLQAWISGLGQAHEASLLAGVADATGGDILFLVSVAEIVPRNVRTRYRATLVIHASALPKGRGWSPWVWQILEGARQIAVCAITADDHVDTGAIWAQRTFDVAPHEIAAEIHAKLFAAELELMSEVIERFGAIEPRPQGADGATYYRRRAPEDSRLDPHLPLAEQFDLLRICDPERYPAFFELHGHRYKLTLDKLS